MKTPSGLVPWSLVGLSTVSSHTLSNRISTSTFVTNSWTTYRRSVPLFGPLRSRLSVCTVDGGGACRSYKSLPDAPHPIHETSFDVLRLPISLLTLMKSTSSVLSGELYPSAFVSELPTLPQLVRLVFPFSQTRLPCLSRFRQSQTHSNHSSSSFNFRSYPHPPLLLPASTPSSSLSFLSFLSSTPLSLSFLFSLCLSLSCSYSYSLPPPSLPSTYAWISRVPFRTSGPLPRTFCLADRGVNSCSGDLTWRVVPFLLFIRFFGRLCNTLVKVVFKFCVSVPVVHERELLSKGKLWQRMKGDYPRISPLKEKKENKKISEENFVLLEKVK